MIELLGMMSQCHLQQAFSKKKVRLFPFKFLKKNMTDKKQVILMNCTIYSLNETSADLIVVRTVNFTFRYTNIISLKYI